MKEIRKLKESDIDDFVRIVTQSYPEHDFFSEDANHRLKERLTHTVREDPSVNLYGYYRDGRLLGGMRWHDFIMNVHGIRMLAGGIGLVAVDLLHRKERIAREMLSHFIRRYRDRGFSMTLLYPFRVDFYKRMGFGVGTKMNRYAVVPKSLPNRGKHHLVQLGKSDQDAIIACYNRYASRTHGMIEKTGYETRGLLDTPEHVIVGCKQGDVVTGYLVFHFRHNGPGQAGLTDIVIKELIYDNREALSELLTFLHSLSDQVNRIIFHTQDEHFHFLLSDPRNGTHNLLPHVFHETHTSGVGLMYRVINIRRVFEQLGGRNFGGCNVKLKLNIQDSFCPDNNGSVVVHFRDGYPRVADGEAFDLECTMDVSDFSSLLMGCVPFQSLYRYGLADVSDPLQADVLDRLFHTGEKPICTTPF